MAEFVGSWKEQSCDEKADAVLKSMGIPDEMWPEVQAYRKSATTTFTLDGDILTQTLKAPEMDDETEVCTLGKQFEFKDVTGVVSKVMHKKIGNRKFEEVRTSPQLGDLVIKFVRTFSDDGKTMNIVSSNGKISGGVAIWVRCD